MANTIEGPYKKAEAVTPSDSGDLPNGVCRAVYIGNVTGGPDLAVTLWDGNAITFENLQAGQILPIQVKKVHATGTTVDKVIALY